MGEGRWHKGGVVAVRRGGMRAVGADSPPSVGEGGGDSVSGLFLVEEGRMPLAERGEEVRCSRAEGVRRDRRYRQCEMRVWP